MIETFVKFDPLFALVGDFQLFSEAKEKKYIFEGTAEGNISASEIKILNKKGEIVDTIKHDVNMRAGDTLLFEYRIDVEYF